MGSVQADFLNPVMGPGGRQLAARFYDYLDKRSLSLEEIT
jgi:hypothetical protein